MRALVGDPITSTLSSACIAFAKRAIQLSEGLDFRDVVDYLIEHDIKRLRVAEQVIGAVVVSVASIEGLINEIISGAVDPIYKDRPPGDVSMATFQRWGRLWQRGAFRRLGILEKCQVALEAADLDPLPTDEGVVQDTVVLISLRNELVHAETKYRPHGIDLPHRDRDSLERKLMGKFPENRLAQRSAPFIWQRCLGAGCAKWCAETECEFQNSLFEVLGVPIRGKIEWNWEEDSA